jgi:hypothetical protein
MGDRHWVESYTEIHKAIENKFRSTFLLFRVHHKCLGGTGMPRFDLDGEQTHRLNISDYDISVWNPLRRNGCDVPSTQKLTENRPARRDSV